MPRNSSGTYSLPAGNPVVTATVISSSWANSTLSDVAAEITDSLSRSGDGGMLAALELDDGTVGAPGLSWGTESNAGLYRAGAADFRWSVAGADVLKLGTNLFQIQGTAPIFRVNETDAAANNRVWDFIASAEQLAFRVGNDALGAFVNWLTVDRTANTIDLVSLTAPTVFTSAGGAGVNAGSINVTNASPSIVFDESDAAASNKRWTIYASAENFAIAAIADSSGAGTDFMSVSRTGTTVDNIGWSSTTMTYAGRETFSASWSVNNAGAIVLNSAIPVLEFFESDAASNQKSWFIFANGEQFAVGAGSTDDHSTIGSPAILIDRTGNVIDSIALQGPLLLASIHNGTATGGSAAPAIASGTYTPTLTNGANVDSTTSAVCQYIRVGNVVTVSGVVSVDPTASGGTATQVGISFPIASNLASTTQCGGGGAHNVNSPTGVLITSDTANDRAQATFAANTTASASMGFTFTYLVV